MSTTISSRRSIRSDRHRPALRRFRTVVAAGVVAGIGLVPMAAVAAPAGATAVSTAPSEPRLDRLVDAALASATRTAASGGGQREVVAAVSGPFTGTPGLKELHVHFDCDGGDTTFVAIYVNGHYRGQTEIRGCFNLDFYMAF